ncbi:MAG: metallophosphoesterase [Lachnospiraceae bacterium]|nr:metallophosphoesterase [Lachnospiraceae bacterium]
MKALIVSDTHGMDNNLYKVIKKVGSIDMLIHAGDIQGSERDIENAVLGCAVKMVTGNNDYGSPLSSVEEFEFDGYQVLLTHGHRDGVYYGTDRLMYKAAELGANIVIYGHTHMPSVEYDPDLHVWAVNPGSLSLPRQDGRRPSFAIMETDRFGEVHFTVNFL